MAERHASVGRRALATLAVVAFALIAVVGSLSDGAPDIVRALANALEELWDRARVAFGFDSPVGRDDIPWRRDELAHLFGWGGGMVVLGLVLRGTRRADVVAATLFVGSVALEILQAFVTADRSLSLSDASANAVGILSGLVVVVVVDAVLPRRSRGDAVGL